MAGGRNQFIPQEKRKERRVVFLVDESTYKRLWEIAQQEYNGNISDMVRDVLNQKFAIEQETGNAS